MRTPPASLRPLGVMLSAAWLLGSAGCADSSESTLDLSAPWTVASFASTLPAATETPNLSSTEDGAVLSWWAHDGEETVLRWASVTGGGLGPSGEIVRGSDFFVNWADFPSITRLPSGRLVAHWLQRGDDGGYDYGVRVATSTDEGTTWDAPWTPHVDGTPTEHGFVSVLPEGDDAFSLYWLDGRKYAAGPHGDATDEMTLRMRARDGAAAGDEVLVDDMVCDCCQTSAAMTASGPILVYRNRTPEEIRDIYFVRRVDGAWTEPAPIHDDGWVMPACPVNGPQVDADGDFVVVSWFTGEGDRPRVHAKVSTDGGATFGEALRIDHGNPTGRVDVVATGTGRALISWVEGTAGRTAEIRVQEVGTEGLVGDWTMLAATSSARSSGFPRMVRTGTGDVIAAWTDVSGEEPVVRLARLHRESTTP